MQSILAFWAKSLNCPVCGLVGLDIIREPGVPDLLHCRQCETEFEVSELGDQIRLLQFPHLLGIELYGVWMPYGKVREKIREKLEKENLNLASLIPVTGGQKVMPQTTIVNKGHRETHELAEPPEQAVQQARKLMDLGNSRREIRSILEKDPQLNPRQIDRIMEIIEEPQRSKTLVRLLLMVLVVLVLVVIGLLLYPTGIFNRAILAVGGVISGEEIPLIPPTPSVVQYAKQGRVNTCPPTEQGAAALFGGSADHWRFDGKNWIYTDVRGVRIYVPEGLSARYTYLTPMLEFKTVEGPALIDPIMAVSIDCYQ